MDRKTNGPPPNPPKKHHYIPAFYLSRWAIGPDSRLCQYSKPHKVVVANRRHPEATGFVEKLYQLHDMSDDVSQIIEDKFFKPVDTFAADALVLMETDGNKAKWDSRRRSAWSTFLHSLLLRAPEDISDFKEAWRDLMHTDYSGEWEARYQEIRKPSQPATFAEYMAAVPQANLDNKALEALTHIINSQRVGKRMNAMVWHVIDTSASDHLLLTSDRPTIRTNGMMIDGGHIAMPIGPRTLFIAARDHAALYGVLGVGVKELVRETNRQVCNHAIKYVYGIDDSQIEYVRKHFGTKPQPRLLQSTTRDRQAIAKEMRPTAFRIRDGERR